MSMNGSIPLECSQQPYRVIRESLPFLDVLLLVLAAVTYVTSLSLALPRLRLGG